MLNPFAESSRGRSLALGCELIGERPGVVLGMDELERHLLLQCAGELESWRFEQWSKLLGGE